MTKRLYIGDAVNAKLAASPVSLAASTDNNGNAVDRLADADVKLSALLAVATGAASGGPSTIAVDCRVQDSADGSTGWADLLDEDGNVYAITQITAVDSIAEVSVLLREGKKFVRTVTDVAFTGGTSPEIVVAPLLIVGGSDVEPAA